MNLRLFFCVGFVALLPGTASVVYGQYKAALVTDLYPGIFVPGPNDPTFGIGPTPNSSHPSDLMVYDGRLFFAAAGGGSHRELWVYATTRQEVTNVAVLRIPQYVRNRTFLVAYGCLFFWAGEGGNARYGGWELFSICSGGGATPVAANIISGSGRAPDGLSYPEGLAAYDGRLFFSAIGGGLGRELWAYDVDAGEATLAADINPGGAETHSEPTAFAVYDDRLFFSANDGTHGDELWAYDADTGEATLVANIAPEPEDHARRHHGSEPANLVVYDNRLFFSATDEEHGRELWAYDAVADEASLIADIDLRVFGYGGAHSEPSNLTVYDDRLFFTASDGKLGWELWVYDAVTDEAIIAADVNAGEANSFPTDLTVYDNRLFFGARGSGHDHELWSYDVGTGKATLVADIKPGPFGSVPSDFTVYDGRLFFSANDGEHGAELWALSPVASSD